MRYVIVMTMIAIGMANRTVQHLLRRTVFESHNEYSKHNASMRGFCCAALRSAKAPRARR